MLKFSDLSASKELESKAMRGIVGGTSVPEQLSGLLDFSTRLDNRVADVNQAFGFGLSQANAGAVTNNQAISGGNGVVYAPVSQYQTQGNYMNLYDIGNTWVS
jgi:hypothetical protein